MASFRVGITSDFRVDPGSHGLLDDALREMLDPRPELEYEFLPHDSQVVPADDLGSYDVVISLLPRYTRESFSRADRLVGIGRWGVGYDMIDVEACTDADVALFITPDAVRRPMAESILALILALSKDMLWKDRLVRQGQWARRTQRVGTCLVGRTLGTVGLGNIGGELVRLARPLGIRTMLAFDPYASPDRAAALRVELVDLATLLQSADFVVVNCPLTPETRHLIGEPELRLMRPSASLVNTARGPIVDTEALVAALRAGTIRGAALDVFEDEPLSPDHPLCSLDNVILTPHAISRTEEVVRDTSAEVCAGVLALLDGHAPRKVVNREVLGRPGFRRKITRLRSARRAGAGRTR